MPRVIATLCMLLLPGPACAGWAQVRGPDGVVRLVEVPGACGPAGSVAPAPPVDPADVAPRLPQAPTPTPPMAQPTRPLVPLAPQADATEPKRPRPEPEIFRVETPDPLRIEPVGPGFIAIAEALAAIGRQSAAPAASASCPIPDTPDQAAPPPAAMSARSGLAGDVIYWALAAAAGATGIGVPSVGIWAAWRVARALIGKIGSQNTHVSSLEASFQRANSGAGSAEAEKTAESLRWYTDQLDAQAAEAASLRRRIAQLEAQVKAAPNAVDTSELARLRAELANCQATIAELERKNAERPVTYLQPPTDDGLARMRQAMKDVSESYAAARPWVRMFEDAYRIILSGEKKYGQ